MAVEDAVDRENHEYGTMEKIFSSPLLFLLIFILWLFMTTMSWIQHKSNKSGGGEAKSQHTHAPAYQQPTATQQPCDEKMHLSPILFTDLRFVCMEYPSLWLIGFSCVFQPLYLSLATIFSPAYTYKYFPALIWMRNCRCQIIFQ